MNGFETFTIDELRIALHRVDFSRKSATTIRDDVVNQCMKLRAVRIAEAEPIVFRDLSSASD